MTQSEFQQLVTPLTDAYPRNHLSAHKLRLIWDCVRGITGDHFRDVVDTIIGEDIKLTVSNIQEVVRQNARGQAQSHSCSHCEGSGWVLLPEVNPPVVKRCQCMGGTAALANSIRNAKVNPNPGEADRIEKYWEAHERQQREDDYSGYSRSY